jgi:hypothetical protein
MSNSALNRQPISWGFRPKAGRSLKRILLGTELQGTEAFHPSNQPACGFAQPSRPSRRAALTCIKGFGPTEAMMSEPRPFAVHELWSAGRNTLKQTK